MSAAHDEPAPKKGHRRRGLKPPDEPPPPPARIDDDPRLDGWRWRTQRIRGDQFGALVDHHCLIAPDGWETKLYQKPTKAIAEALRRVRSLPKEKPVSTPTETIPELPEIPPDLLGWEWELSDAGDARLTHPAEGYATSWGPAGPDADYGGRLGEARKRVAADVAVAAEERAEQPAATHQIPPATIRRDGGTQARTGNNEDVVEEYTNAMREGRWTWHAGNRLVVFFDGSDHWLADGFHRTEAAQRAELAVVPCEVRRGSRRDAVLYAVGANADHGLRRTRDDVRRAIRTLLLDEEWRAWSNAEIARRARTTDKTVATVRAEMESTSEIPRLTERVGADGKARAISRFTPQPETPEELRAAGFRLLRSSQKPGQVKLIEAGQQPSYYASAPAATAAARERIRGRSTPTPAHTPRPHPPCARCGVTSAVLIGKACEGCYSLIEAQKWGDGSEDARWRLAAAQAQAERDPDEERRRRRLAEIAGIARNMGFTSLEAPPTPAPAAGEPRCYDCGTAEDVVAVGGAVGHLCRSCRVTRGGPITDDLSPEAVAAGYAYRYAGGTFKVEQRGEFRRWIYSDGTGDREAYRRKAVAAVEALAAPPPDAPAPATPEGPLTSEEANARGIYLHTPRELIPADWDTWQARAQAAGGALTLGVNGMVTGNDGWRRLGSYRIADQWALMTAEVEAMERAASPARTDEQARIDANVATRLADDENDDAFAPDGPPAPPLTPPEYGEWEARARAVGATLTRDEDWRYVLTLPDGSIEPREGWISTIARIRGLEVDSPPPAPTEAEEPDAIPADARPTYAAAEQRLSSLLAAADPELKRFLRVIFAVAALSDDPLSDDDLWDELTGNLIAAGDELLAYALGAAPAPAPAPADRWPHVEHAALEELSTELMGAELASVPPDGGDLARWQDALDAHAAELDDATYERLAHRIGELRGRGRAA